jgi:hypothetical protein
MLTSCIFNYRGVKIHGPPIFGKKKQKKLAILNLSSYIASGFAAGKNRVRKRTSPNFSQMGVNRG